DYTFTGGDAGVHTFSGGVTLVTAGEQTVTATDDVTGTITGTQAEITVEPTIALSGTIPTATEGDIVTGGQTIILTLTGDTWHANIGAENDTTQMLLDGLDADAAEATGWDAVVKSGLAFGDVERTSATVVTITLQPFPSYDITADETITVTIPASALNQASGPIVATPTFMVTFVP
ncbi:MAG TPA: hypothetical protein VGA37_11310, partial [Gemmatimonadales bacterium]